jgi:hypothetical protein
VGTVATAERIDLIELRKEVDGLRKELEQLRSLLTAKPQGNFKMFTPEETARIRGQLAPFLKDWEAPEMDVYDQDAVSQ